MTRQRQAIARVLIEADDHPDAEQILTRASKKEASVSQATTYRTLAVLAKKGLLRTHTFDEGATRFELANRPHHNHLIDVETGEIKEFVSTELEKIQRQIAEEHGYEIVAHRLKLYCRRITTPRSSSLFLSALGWLGHPARGSTAARGRRGL